VSGIQNAPWYSQVFSLRWRLAFVCSALLVVFVTILSIFLYYSTSDQLLNSAQMAFQQRALVLRSSLIQEVCGSSPAQTPGDFIRQNISNDISAIYLLNRAGKVVAGSNSSLLNRPFPYVNQTLLASADANEKQGQRFSASSSLDGLLLSLPILIRCQGLPAYIAVLPSYTSEQNTMSTILLLLGVTSVVMISVGVVIISFATALMLKPLQQVTRATRALAQGNLQQRVPLLQSNDEIGDLAESFNQMANRIEQMFIAQQAAEQRARRFVSDASHELRTPITSLRGFTEVLIRGAKDDPATAQRVLNLMKNEAERMTKLVNDLLTLARLDEGHFAEPEDIDLIDLAVDCLQEARKMAPKDCRLGLELVTHKRLKIYAGREPLKQMLLILLDNAIKYGCTGEQKKLMLLLNRKVQHVLIEVVDYGVGITADDLPHVFDRFYRGKNARSSAPTPIPGTGLGLPIATAIAQVYHGTIMVCSDPGKETIFTVSFPCSE
jgi:signal transduction histidine kinase